MPGEPKLKKFEDWQKKATIYYNSFKNAKVCAPRGCPLACTRMSVRTCARANAHAQMRTRKRSHAYTRVQRTIPEGAEPIIVPGKKDTVQVIVPEQTLFEWNASPFFFSREDQD